MAVLSVESIRDKLLANPIVMQIPIGAGDTFHGIIDLLKMQAVFYKTEKMGAIFEETDIPEEFKDKALEQRNQMVEKAAEYDEELMDAYVHDNPVSIEMIQRAVRSGTLNNNLHPVFVGSALKYIGVQRLLDGVLAFLPSPLDRPDIKGHKPNNPDKQILIKCDPNGSFVGLAFKITSDVHGDLYFLRIYQGTLKSGSRVLNSNQNRRENITRIFEMHANERNVLSTTSAGDIVAVVGLKQTFTGVNMSHYPDISCFPQSSHINNLIALNNNLYLLKPEKIKQKKTTVYFQKNTVAFVNIYFYQAK
ncbi:EF-Tu/IF-2/RF-3 family GTPase [Planctomycetota bacterium]